MAVTGLTSLSRKMGSACRQEGKAAYKPAAVW